MDRWAWLSNLVVAALVGARGMIGLAVRAPAQPACGASLGGAADGAGGAVSLLVAGRRLPAGRPGSTAVLLGLGRQSRRRTGPDADQVALHKPRSVIDRACSPPRCSSERQLLGAAGRRALSTAARPLDLSGAPPARHRRAGRRRAAPVALKGVRVALLIGGLTSPDRDPDRAHLRHLGAGYFGGRIDDVVFFLMTRCSPRCRRLLLLIALIMALGHRHPCRSASPWGLPSWVGFSPPGARRDPEAPGGSTSCEAARALGRPPSVRYHLCATSCPT